MPTFNPNAPSFVPQTTQPTTAQPAPAPAPTPTPAPAPAPNAWANSGGTSLTAKLNKQLVMNSGNKVPNFGTPIPVGTPGAGQDSPLQGKDVVPGQLGPEGKFSVINLLEPDEQKFLIDVIDKAIADKEFDKGLEFLNAITDRMHNKGIKKGSKNTKNPKIA